MLAARHLERKTPTEAHKRLRQRVTNEGSLALAQSQALAIKLAYGQIRDRVLRDFPDVVKANLAIEPLDQVAIGAWAAKDHGILRFAKKSLHFEMPSHRVFYRKNARRAYRKILAELILRIINTPKSDS